MMIFAVVAGVPKAVSAPLHTPENVGGRFCCPPRGLVSSKFLDQRIHGLNAVFQIFTRNVDRIRAPGHFMSASP